MLRLISSKARSLGSSVAHRSLAAACPSLRPRNSRATGVCTMAFVSQRNEQLCGLARQFVSSWGAADKEALRGLVAEDAAFKADGVIYTTDTTGREAILDALEREHKTHEHTTYAPVAVAADEDKRLAFVAVAWELKNTASNRASRGFSIKQLAFNQHDQLVLSAVNRQLTADEMETLLNPGVKVQPADVLGDVLPKLAWRAQEASEKPVAEPEFAAKMAASLETWVSCWGTSNQADVESKIQQVLAPGFMAYDAWGFHHAADKPGREGHAVAMMGQAEAAGAINALHAKFEDRQTLLASAVNVDQRVAFDHWRGEAEGRDSDAHCVVEGVDLALFDEEGRITTLVQFDMQDYSRLLRSNAPAPAAAADE